MVKSERIRKKELEIILQKLEAYSNPDLKLEQYMTPGDVAAALLHLAYSQGAIKDKVVYDLGCGTGRLTVGAALLGAKKMVGIDIDKSALEVARQNAEEMKVDIEWVCSDVGRVESQDVDTVIQNPPFGVQRRGADMVFLGKALDLADEVYSLHKAGRESREFIAGWVRRKGKRITHRLELDFHIRRQFDFHTKDVHRFKVDLYRILKG